MKINEAFPSSFLKADDLHGKDVNVTIQGVTLETFGKGHDQEQKVIVAFVGKQKKLVANKTNCKTIAKLYGDDTDGWLGKTITLSPREVEFQGEMVWAIRVSLKAPGAPGQATAPIGTPVPAMPARTSSRGPVTPEQEANLAPADEADDSVPF